MIQARDRASFLQEVFELVLGSAQGRGQELKGDFAIEAGVAGAINDAHAALGDALDEFVMGNALAQLGNTFSHYRRLVAAKKKPAP